MIRTRWMWMFGPVLIASAVGCGGGTPQAATAAPGTADVAPAGTTPTEEEDESMAELKEHHRHHHHGGFAMFIAMSLNSLGTTPEQNAAIVKIQDDIRAKTQPAHDAEKGLLSALADGVAAGNVDAAKVDAAISQLSSAAAGIHDAVADSLNQLHATLTPPQRAALVEKVEAHYNVWRSVNENQVAGEKEARPGHLAKLSKELGLTPDQTDKIRAAFKATAERKPAHFDPAVAEAHLKAFGDAFQSDTFDAHKLTEGAGANGQMATWGATRTAHFYEAAAPVLTPDQRAKAADLLRKHANYTQNRAGASGT